MGMSIYGKMVFGMSIALCVLCHAAHADERLMVRPAPDAGPTPIWFLGYIIDVHAVNSSDQSFTANIFYRLRWQDPRLADPSGTARILPLEEVWHPRLQMTNQQKVWNTFPEEVDVSPQGEVLYRQRVYGTFSQALNLYEFPFDRQSFAVQLAAIGLDTNDVQLLAEPDAPSGISSQLSLAGWTISGMHATATPYAPLPKYPALPGFVIGFQADRQMGYYIYKIILPLVLIVMMSWLGFWIHPTQAGVQISVAVTSMLTLIAFRFMVSGFLPSISYLTRLDKLVLGSTILVFASLVEVIYTANLANREEMARALAVDRKSRIVFPVAFALLMVSTMVI